MPDELQPYNPCFPLVKEIPNILRFFSDLDFSLPCETPDKNREVSRQLPLLNVSQNGFIL
jgi:hypothetical protein